MLSPLLEPLVATNLPSPLRQLLKPPDTCPTFNLLLPPHLLLPMPHLLLPMPHLLPQLPPTRHLTLLPQLHLLPDLDQLLTWMLSPLLEPLVATNLPGPLRQLPKPPDTCPTFNLEPQQSLFPSHLPPQLPPTHLLMLLPLLLLPHLLPHTHHLMLLPLLLLLLLPQLPLELALTWMPLPPPEPPANTNPLSPSRTMH